MDSTVYKKLAEAVTGRPLPITIKNDQTEESREFVIKQPTFELLIETSAILAEIGLNDVQDLFDKKNVFEFIVNHGDKVLKVLSIMLDSKVEYSQDTYDFLKANLTPHECFDVLSNIVLRIGTQDFQKSIIAMIPMSLHNQTEIIALVNKYLTPSSS